MAWLKKLIGAFLLTLAWTVGVGQDPAKVTPETHNVILENERVRVLDVRLKPGQKVPAHSHPDYVVYALTSFKVKFTSPDGKSTVVYEGNPGDAAWRTAETHSAENIGTSELHVLNIELR